MSVSQNYNPRQCNIFPPENLFNCKEVMTKLEEIAKQGAKVSLNQDQSATLRSVKWFPLKGMFADFYKR